MFASMQRREMAATVAAAFDGKSLFLAADPTVGMGATAAGMEKSPAAGAGLLHRGLKALKERMAE